MLLVGLLAYLPFAFGGVHAFSHAVLVGVAFLIAVLLTLRSALAREERFVWTWAYLPIGLFLGLLALQLVELPRSIVELLSPGTAHLKHELLSDPKAAIEHLQHMTLSFYPQATASDLRLLLAGAVVFIAIVNVIRTTAQIKRMLAAISIIGGALTFLCLAQDLTGTDRLYWSIETPGRATSGPFVHYGHFSAFLNLALGAALGLLLVRLREQCAGQQLTLELVVRQLRGTSQVANLLLAAFLVAGMIAVAFSMSRNGIISLIVGVLFVLASLQMTRFVRGIGWPIFGLLAAAFVGVLLLNFDPVYDRLATLGAAEDAYSIRGDLLRDVLSVIAAFPLLGTGSGAHEMVFPGFDTAKRPGTAAHAENLYAELFEETGAIGFALVLVLAALVWSAWLRGVRRANERPIEASAFGLALGLVAVAWHSFTDFGLRIPAVAALATVACGLLVAMQTRGTHRATQQPVSRGLGAALALLLAVGLGLALPAVNDARAAEWHWRHVAAAESELDSKGWQGNPAAYERLLTHANAAVALEGGNVKRRYLLAAYGWRRAVQGDDLALASYGPASEDDPRVVAARQTARSLLGARLLAPTYGPIWSVLGQLHDLVLDEPEGQRWVARGYQLAPHNPDCCLAYGRQTADLGNDEAAIAAFERGFAVGLSWARVRELLLGKLERPDLALRLAQGDFGRLLDVADRLSRRRGFQLAAQELRRQTIENMEAKCEAADAPPHLAAAVGMFWEQPGWRDDERAATFYSRHVEKDHGSRYRMNLALALFRLGRLGEAEQHARTLLGIHPDMLAAKDLLGRIAAAR